MVSKKFLMLSTLTISIVFALASIIKGDILMKTCGASVILTNIIFIRMIIKER